MSGISVRELAREVAHVRSMHVDGVVQRRIDRCNGECSTAQIEAWEAESYKWWRETFPALNALLPSHLPPADVPEDTPTHRLQEGGSRLPDGQGWSCSGCAWKFSYDVSRERAAEVWAAHDGHRADAPEDTP